jgi:rubrerythrin
MLIESLENLIFNAMKLKSLIDEFILKHGRNNSKNLNLVLQSISKSQDVHLRNLMKALSHALNAEIPEVQANILINNSKYMKNDLIEFENIFQKIKRDGMHLIKKSLKEAKKTDDFISELALSFAFKSYSQYIKLLKSVDKDLKKGGIPRLKDVYICQSCGNIILNESPINCPVCRHNKKFFMKI